jgi:hypothetical protein
LDGLHATRLPICTIALLHGIQSITNTWYHTWLRSAPLPQPATDSIASPVADSVAGLVAGPIARTPSLPLIRSPAPSPTSSPGVAAGPIASAPTERWRTTTQALKPLTALRRLASVPPPWTSTRLRTKLSRRRPPPSSTSVPSSPSCSIRPRTPTASGVSCSSSFSANMP